MHETGYVRQDTGDWILETGDVRQVTRGRYIDTFSKQVMSESF